MPDFWSGCTWATVDSRLPVESHRFKTEEEAKAWADKKRREIRKRGWTHIVTVNPGMMLR